MNAKKPATLINERRQAKGKKSGSCITCVLTRGALYVFPRIIPGFARCWGPLTPSRLRRRPRLRRATESRFGKSACFLKSARLLKVLAFLLFKAAQGMASARKWRARGAASARSEREEQRARRATSARDGERCRERRRARPRRAALTSAWIVPFATISKTKKLAHTYARRITVGQS